MPDKGNAHTQHMVARTSNKKDDPSPRSIASLYVIERLRVTSRVIRCPSSVLKDITWIRRLKHKAL